ncbi:MAG TPA: L,D-transpeptidase [Chthoniobacter sp.]|jgi:lipoprotein-anchoring transpeptidase ErfK/SrfK
MPSKTIKLRGKMGTMVDLRGLQLRPDPTRCPGECLTSGRVAFDETKSDVICPMSISHMSCGDTKQAVRSTNRRLEMALGPTVVCLFLTIIATAIAQPVDHANGAKWVVIDKTHQILRAYDGNRLVMQSRVSTGREGRKTPDGTFHVEAKMRMHHSRLYHNAPMPYSVQIAGNYFIHGFSSVLAHPASHGCVRLPISSAKRFFEWADSGTPIEITGKWRE